MAGYLGLLLAVVLVSVAPVHGVFDWSTGAFYESPGGGYAAAGVFVNGSLVAAIAPVIHAYVGGVLEYSVSPMMNLADKWRAAGAPGAVSFTFPGLYNWTIILDQGSLAVRGVAAAPAVAAEYSFTVAAVGDEGDAAVADNVVAVTGDGYGVVFAGVCGATRVLPKLVQAKSCGDKVSVKVYRWNGSARELAERALEETLRASAVPYELSPPPEAPRGHTAALRPARYNVNWTVPVATVSQGGAYAGAALWLDGEPVLLFTPVIIVNGTARLVEYGGLADIIADDNNVTLVLPGGYWSISLEPGLRLLVRYTGNHTIIPLAVLRTGNVCGVAAVSAAALVCAGEDKTVIIGPAEYSPDPLAPRLALPVSGDAELAYNVTVVAGGFGEVVAAARRAGVQAVVREKDIVVVDLSPAAYAVAAASTVTAAYVLSRQRRQQQRRLGSEPHQ